MLFLSPGATRLHGRAFTPDELDRCDGTTSSFITTILNSTCQWQRRPIGGSQLGQTPKRSELCTGPRQGPRTVLANLVPSCPQKVKENYVHVYVNPETENGIIVTCVSWWADYPHPVEIINKNLPVNHPLLLLCGVAPVTGKTTEIPTRPRNHMTTLSPSLPERPNTA